MEETPDIRDCLELPKKPSHKEAFDIVKKCKRKPMLLRQFMYPQTNPMKCFSAWATFNKL